jgi:uncharacterized phage-associated protein
MPSYTPSLVANAFIQKALQTGVPVSHMKVQKLVFFVHAWSLALHGQSMIAEKPEAWTYGPVFDSLYHELKSYGYRNIDAYLTQMNPQTGQRQSMVPQFSDSAFWSLLQQVWDRYSKFSATQLSAMTHEAGGPWQMARQLGSGWLDDVQVQNYYRAQLPTHAG